MARREPSAILLVAQLAGVLLYPFMEDERRGPRALQRLRHLVLGPRPPGGTQHAGAHLGGVLLGLPATVLLLIQAVTGDDDLLPYSSALEAVLYFYAAGALIAYMLADHEITRDELFAVGATFTLVAWGFAYTFIVVPGDRAGQLHRRDRPDAASGRGWSCCSSASRR